MHVTTNNDTDIAVVPISIPIIIGPATTGTLLVLGAELNNLVQKIIGIFALLIAAISLGIILFSASLMQHYLGNRGINIMSKLTGLVLAALASQMTMTGIMGFLKQ